MSAALTSLPLSSNFYFVGLSKQRHTSQLQLELAQLLQGLQAHSPQPGTAAASTHKRYEFASELLSLANDYVKGTGLYGVYRLPPTAASTLPPGTAPTSPTLSCT